MKIIKVKFLILIPIIMLALSMFMVLVWAVGESKKINLKGSVDFIVSGNSIYIKDIRIKDLSDTGQGTTIDNFLPGFVDTSFELNLGQTNIDESVIIIIDIVNTTETYFTPTTDFSTPNGTTLVEGDIYGDNILPSQVQDAQPSGQVVFTISTTDPSVNLDKLNVSLIEYTPQVYDYFDFDINTDNTTVTLTKFYENLAGSSDIVIPKSVSQNENGEWIEGNTYAVTDIHSASSTARGVFYDSEITSVVLPETLKSIGNYAFANCGALKTVDLSKCADLTKIGEFAFQYCYVLAGDFDLGNCTSLTSIGDSAFYNCFALKGELNLGECTSLVSIGEWSFRYCSSLIDELDLSNCTNLTSIGENAFQNCRSLTGVVKIPVGVTQIGESVFSGCSNLDGIVVEEGNSKYYSEGNCLIESSTKTIIAGCNNSTIPNDIKIIGDYAFFNCSGLTSITLPSSLTSIMDSAFRNCSGLTRTITIPSNVSEIGNNPFAGCSNLDGIAVATGNSKYYVKGNSLIDRTTKTLISGFKNFTIPNDIEIIGFSAFQGCNGLTSVDLSNCTSLIEISPYAFDGCSGLTTISLPSSLESIGNAAFQDCSNLTSITLPSSITFIYSGQVFSGCRSLTEVIIDSKYVYTRATSASACGYLLNYAKTVKVLTSLVEAGENSYITTNFPNVSTEVIDGKNYTVYSEN